MYLVISKTLRARAGVFSVPWAFTIVFCICKKITIFGTIRMQFVKLIEKFSCEIQGNLRKNLRSFRLYNFSGKFVVIKILTSKNEHCRNATCNKIEKLRRHF